MRERKTPEGEHRGFHSLGDRHGGFRSPAGIKQHRPAIVQVDIQARRAGLSVRHRAAHLGRGLVLAQPLIHDLPQQIVVGPGQEFHLGHELGPHPMHAA
jgi:hypothetical protein